MSAEKEKLERLVERIDELLVVLNKVSEDLRTVSASIKSVAVSQITQPAPQTPAAVSHEIHDKKKSIEDIRMAFPEDLENLLSFEEKDEYIMIKPRQFLGSENFAKIASTVRGMGGEYISAGKDSHFRVTKKKT
jgi:Rps23 Pro-64 3,4-dihydroxylase Tpa1-like proline 4-hydroxylase